MFITDLFWHKSKNGFPTENGYYYVKRMIGGISRTNYAYFYSNHQSFYDANNMTPAEYDPSLVMMGVYKWKKARKPEPRENPIPLRKKVKRY